MEMLRPLFKERRDLDIYIVPGAPVLYIRGKDLLVFSDLHLGFEEAVARGLDYSGGKTGYAVGMFIPRIQLKRILNILDYVFSVVKPNRVLINGDLKHAFDRLLRQERVEVKAFIEYLYEHSVKDIVVVRGNHDNYLPLILKDYGIDLVKYYELETDNYRLLFIHGHFEIDIRKYDLVVMGHEHPSMRCFGSYRFPVFLKVPVREGGVITVLPATGPYHPGTQITLNPNDYLSPLIKSYSDLGSARVVTWIDLGGEEGVSNTVYLGEGVFDTGLVDTDIYRVGGREVAVLEFSSIEVALLMCGSV